MILIILLKLNWNLW